MGLAGAWISSYAATPEDLDRIKEATAFAPAQSFNMSGYAAPKLETVRIGFVGIGNRGFDAVTRMNKIEGVEIKGLCDLRPERVKLVTTWYASGIHRIIS